MKAVNIIPVVGQTYQNRNGRQYLCMEVRKRHPLCDAAAVFRRLSDGWTLTAHGIVQYEDGTIEWNYSTGGRWCG